MSGYCSFAIQAYQAYKTVQPAIVARDRLIDLQHVGREVRATNQLYWFVRLALMVHTIIVLYRIINTLCGTLGVQFARVTVLVHAVIIIDAVSRVGCLLYLA